ncbi:MAG TPA: hypothetical protein VN253_09530 [Kofleriaceae bacterium]|nr:hypothetical protein [Kofleriaceae bacterium]
MTSGHILFIPGAIMIGMFLGFILGARAARNQFDLQQRRTEERAAARAARVARDAKRAAGDGAKAEPDDAAGKLEA